ncbi:hypothetical protein HW114_14010 [Serratia symbiotica]|uniref:hypothetical protein n=1 Tax=Serratia symbiotica TaxID=138074 RepID=UPI001886FFB7|nr:hypothetical protein [Serratia symbiotica]MBF1996498.1 hypothetical protein [Serratia symbiotica]
MLKLPGKAFGYAITLIVFCSIFLLYIGFYLNSNFEGYILIFLPLIFSLLITKYTYSRYSKSLKSLVDFIIYIPTSIVASLFLIRIRLEIPAIDFMNMFNTFFVAAYAYFLAIAIATKCCVAFCDAVFAYESEK